MFTISMVTIRKFTSAFVNSWFHRVLQPMRKMKKDAWVIITNNYKYKIMKTIKDFKKDVNIMRNISDKTILTALVNYKCVGYFGKCVAHLNSQERNFVIDELIKRGYLNSDMSIAKSAQTVILKNLNLLQY